MEKIFSYYYEWWKNMDKFIFSSYAILANSDKMSQITFYDIKMFISFSKKTFGASAESIKI